MVRKTDAEVLEELERTKKELAETKKELKKGLDEDEPEYKAEPYNTDDEPPEIEPNKVPTQIVEREINLGLINDKLNFIISQLQK